MAQRTDGLCPCCGKRPRRRMPSGRLRAYCDECYNYYQARRKRAVERARRIAGEKLRQRDVPLDGDDAVAPTIPPEVYEEVRRRGWNASKVITLALALEQMGLDTEKRPDGRVRKCLTYHDRKIYY